MNSNYKRVYSANSVLKALDDYRNSNKLKPLGESGEIRTASLKMFKDRRIKDNLFFVTIKNFKGSDKCDTLKFNLKRMCRYFTKHNITFKLDYIFTIEVDHTNALDLEFLPKEILFHSHLIICTNSSADTILKGVKTIHNLLPTNPQSREFNPLDVLILPITETPNKVISYITKHTVSEDTNYYDFEIG